MLFNILWHIHLKTFRVERNAGKYQSSDFVSEKTFAGDFQISEEKISLHKWDLRTLKCQDRLFTMRLESLSFEDEDICRESAAEPTLKRKNSLGEFSWRKCCSSAWLQAIHGNSMTLNSEQILGAIAQNMKDP
jgi:hypothetical protein